MVIIDSFLVESFGVLSSTCSVEIFIFLILLHGQSQGSKFSLGAKIKFREFNKRSANC